MKKADRDLYQKHLHFLARVLTYCSPPRGHGYNITHDPEQPLTVIYVDGIDTEFFSARIRVAGHKFTSYSVFGCNAWRKRVATLAKDFGFEESTT